MREKEPYKNRRALAFNNSEHYLKVLNILEDISQDNAVEYDLLSVKDQSFLVLPSRVYKLISPTLQKDNLEFTEVKVLPFRFLEPEKQAELRGWKR